MASYDILAEQAAHTLQDTEDDMHPGSITNKLLWPRDENCMICIEKWHMSCPPHEPKNAHTETEGAKSEI